MTWTKEEISTYQIHNNKMLAEINSTLPGLTGNPIVGIFCPGQNGDAITASSVLKYKNKLWPDKDIVWFCNMPVSDFAKYSKEINEVRPWPWANNGLPDGCPDFWPLLMNEQNQLNLELASQYELTKDLSQGYFPCPYMLPVEKRHGIDYPNCSRKVFGVPDDLAWHPVLNFSEEEKYKIGKWFPPYNGIYENPEKREDKTKIIAIETFAGSGQTKMNDSMVRDIMRICREVLKECYFIFVSHKYLREQEEFPDDIPNMDDVFMAGTFSVRECGYIVNCCDFMISVSSGITVAASAWGLKQPVTIQYTGSFICSTKSLANTDKFELVTYDDKPMEAAKKEFYERLEKILIQYK